MDLTEQGGVLVDIAVPLALYVRICFLHGLAGTS